MTLAVNWLAVLVAAVDPNVARALGVGLVVDVGWVATSFGVNYLFAGRRLALFAVDVALTGLIIGLFG